MTFREKESGKYICGLCVLLCCFLFSCKKYLDEKSDKRLAEPSTIQDLQYLLDDYYKMNRRYPSSPELLSDNYYLSYKDWQSLDMRERAYYTWQKNDDAGDWGGGFSSIYQTNVVLDYLNKINYSSSEQLKWNEVRGSALFYRAYFFYSLAQIYAQPYDKITAAKDLGLPLRLNSDFNEPSSRASVQQTYDQITNDLKEASALLPINPSQKNRPCRVAAYAALAKVYLAMQEYVNAGLYSDSCLLLRDALIDFNSLNVSSPNPISEYTLETIFHGVAEPSAALSPSLYKIDSNLYKSYNVDDLRSKVFFQKNEDNTFRPKGNYSGYGMYGFMFAGLATNEMYLIRAECRARGGHVGDALNDLNKLLRNRWKKEKFTPVTASSATQTLQLILQERRRELVFTLTRWSDLKRLNKETLFAATITRVLNGEVYSLEPNGAGYTQQIPKVVIDKTGMPQNP